MKKQPTQPLPPELPEELTPHDALTEALLALIGGHEDIEGALFTGVTFEGLRAKRVSFRGCSFDRCRFAADEEPIVLYDFLDCTFSGCDFAAMRFDRGAFQRVSFTRCRAVGAYSMEAALRNVTFDDCQMSYVNFGAAKLTNVWMSTCDLRYASFGDALLSNVRWDACRLSAAELFGVRLRGMDLRTCEIDGITLGDRRELEGAIVTPLQACELAKLLGVVIA